MASVPSVSVYVTKDTCYVISQLLTDHGRVSAEPMLKLDRRAGDKAIGAAVIRCLDAFQEADAPPPDHFDVLKTFLGARNWKAFTRHAANVSIEKTSRNTISLAVARADDKGAYAYGPSTHCVPDEEEIGRTVRQLADSSDL